jgi:hypothetical protein
MSVLDDSEMESDDIYLSAFFLLSGCVLVRKRRSGPTKIYFVFSNPAGSIKELRQAFFSGKAIVKAHDYSQKIIAMKELLHDG